MKPTKENMDIFMNNGNSVVTFEDIPDYGDMMTIEDFSKSVKGGCYIDDDGYGYLATEDKMSSVVVSPSSFDLTNIPKWTTHVVWFNR